MKKKRGRKLTYSKIMVTIVLAFAIIDIQLSYYLAWKDKATAETLSIAIVTEIVGVMTGYFIKSFRETREEQNLKYKRDRDKITESEEQEL